MVAKDSKGTKRKPASVVAVTRSPLNVLRWNLSLSCGHDVWVTAKNQPTRRLWVCADCDKK